MSLWYIALVDAVSGAVYQAGAVYIFRTFDNGASWIEVLKICAFDGSSNDHFGDKSVSLYENFLLVGAHQDEDNGDDSG